MKTNTIQFDPDLNKKVFDKLQTKLTLICNKYELPVPELKLSNHKKLNGQFKAHYNADELAKAKTMQEIIAATNSMTINVSKYIIPLFGYERAEQTLIHEIAHFLDYIVTKKFSHTETFYNALKFLGGTKINNGYVIMKVGYIYKCPCGAYKRRTIRKISVKMLEKYVCDECNTAMKYWKIRRIG